MAIITGVKFRTPSKVYYFDPGELTLHYNDHVIVETARGVEYGTVVLPVRDVPEEELSKPLKTVIRMATEEDTLRETENRLKEEKAYRICQEKIHEHELAMKLVSAEYTFDNSKLLFYFTADGRIDFRELVKDLAGIFRTRIELRQIGVRDETRIIGGIGICGRPLCCHSYLHDFAPVSIKMAKEQNLSLNPTKISGTCGRLMCCLKNEQETYEYLNRSLPRKGDTATTPDGLAADVQSVNILRQTVRVVVTLDNDEKEMREYPVSEISFVPRKGRKRPVEETQEEEIREEELKELLDAGEDILPESGEHAAKKEKRKRHRKNERDRHEAEGETRSAGEEASKESAPEEERKKSPRRQRRRRNQREDGEQAKGRFSDDGENRTAENRGEDPGTERRDADGAKETEDGRRTDGEEREPRRGRRRDRSRSKDRRADREGARREGAPRDEAGSAGQENTGANAAGERAEGAEDGRPRRPRRRRRRRPAEGGAPEGGASGGSGADA